MRNNKRIMAGIGKHLNRSLDQNELTGKDRDYKVGENVEMQKSVKVNAIIRMRSRLRSGPYTALRPGRKTFPTLVETKFSNCVSRTG